MNKFNANHMNISYNGIGKDLHEQLAIFYKLKLDKFNNMHEVIKNNLVTNR